MEYEPNVSIKNERIIYHVSKRASDGKWQVFIRGSDKVIKLFSTKAEAEEYCEKMAKNQNTASMVDNPKTDESIVKNGSFVLQRKDYLVWWNKVDDAARYRVVLYINEDEVETIDLDRETRYYAFSKLPNGIACIVKVIAENREGNEVVSASIKL